MSKTEKNATINVKDLPKEKLLKLKAIKDPVKSSASKSKNSTTTSKEKTCQKVLIFVCSLCSDLFNNEEEYQSHSCPKAEKSKETKEKVDICCEKCNKKFTRKYHLQRHLLNSKSCSDGSQRQSYTCDVCKKNFTRIDNFKMHLQSHLGKIERAKNFQCSYCDKAFSASSLLNIHIRTHTNEKPFKCDWKDCNKAFPSSGALCKHRRVHTGEKPYECEICKNRFSAKETLNRHVRTHTKHHDHICEICNKSFIQRTQLRSHMFHHTGENGYTCDKCGKQFNRRVRLTEHMQYIHMGKPPLKCTMCEKTFYRREDLSRHMHHHVGERSHECKVCTKKFVTNGALRIHSRIHNVEEPSVCSYCEKSFSRVDCLVRHLRAKHRDALKKIIVDAENKRLEKVKQQKGQYEIIIYEDNPKSADENNIEIELIDGNMIEENNCFPNNNIKQEQRQNKSVIEYTENQNENMGQEIFLKDDDLKRKVAELLEVVIEDCILKKMGYGVKPIEEVLASVIRQCSHTPLEMDDDEDESTIIRENVKRLFSLVLNEDHIKSLLNNYTVDEALLIVLKMSK